MTDFNDLLLGPNRVNAEWLNQFDQATRREPDWRRVCAALIEQAYAHHPEARDGHARVGCFLLECGRADEALDWFEKDLAAGRMGWWQQLRRAECLALLGRKTPALTEIERIYRQYPEARNGHAMPGVRLRDPNLARRDIAANRLTPGYALNVAVLLAETGADREAVRLVEEAYAQDAQLQNGFARLGRVLLARNRQAEARRLYQRDAEANRIRPADRLVLARLLAEAGEASAAIMELARLCAGETHGAAAGGITQLARCAATLRACATLQGQLAEAATLQPADFDVAGQARALRAAALAGGRPADPLRILNARLRAANARDAWIQFQEIVLQECYFFRASNAAPLIIDGGANMGMALAYFKWLYPDARILAFEPHPELHALCAENIRLNEWPNVTLHPAALLDRAGSITLHVLNNEPMGSSITRRLADTRPANESRAVEVACRRLGDCITEPVDFLKLDIEGAETRVLRDLGNRLGLVRRGYIEYHYGPIHDDNALGELLSILEKAGFQYRLAEPAATASQMPLHGRHLTVGTPWSCSIHFSNPHG